MKLAIVVALLVLCAVHRDAGAIAACTGGDGWAPLASVELPPHARIVFWRNDPHEPAPTKLVATIDGKAVKTKTTTVAAAPFEVIVVDIDSDRTGKLELAWQARGGALGDKTTYTVKKGVAMPKRVRATTDRYHAKIGHTSVREVFDGLAIHVDAPAVLAHVKLRRDAKATWTELDTPLADLQGMQLRAGSDGAGYAIRLGELGCKGNYSVPLLEQGVDIDVEVTLVDGSRVHVDDLGHIALAKLAKPTGTRPTDSE
jgi:hypothetical protein